MSSRSLNGQDLNLNNLTATKAVVTNATVSDSATVQSLVVNTNADVLGNIYGAALDINQSALIGGSLQSNSFTTEAATATNMTVTNAATVESLVVNTNLDVAANLSVDALSVATNATMNNLTVTGDFVAQPSELPMEICSFNVTGAAANVTQTIPLQQNTTNTTNYSVFPSIYYGYSGSTGTYDVAQTCASINAIVISGRSNLSFNFSINKATGNNVNIYMTFLVVYGVSSSEYLSAY